MSNPTQPRADAIRAALIEHVSQDLHGDKTRPVTARRRITPALQGSQRGARATHRWANWAAAGVALILIAGVASATFLTASIAPSTIVSGQVVDTPQPAATTRATETPAPTAEGSPAVWQLIEPESVDADSKSVKLSVVRLECAGGETGELFEPRITYEATRVVIEVDAKPLIFGATYSCQGNKPVAITVEFTEPIGERSLVDGGCDEIANLAYTVCVDPIRWH